MTFCIGRRGFISLLGGAAAACRSRRVRNIPAVTKAVCKITLCSVNNDYLDAETIGHRT
jgi:hypothetical protein